MKVIFNFSRNGKDSVMNRETEEEEEQMKKRICWNVSPAKQGGSRGLTQTLHPKIFFLFFFEKCKRGALSVNPPPPDFIKVMKQNTGSITEVQNSRGQSRLDSRSRRFPGRRAG